jgi:hypothetical protein
MFLLGELKISGKGKDRSCEKGELKRTMYSFPEKNEFQLAFSDGRKDDCHFRLYVDLDESEGVTITCGDVKAGIANGYLNLYVKDQKKDEISITLSAEQVNLFYRILENAHLALESLAKLHALEPAELRS